MTEKNWTALADEETAIMDEAQNLDSPEVTPEITLAGVLEHPSYKQLEDKLTQLEEELRLQTDKALRTAAEAENMRRRNVEDMRKAREYTLTEFSRDLLAVADSLEQALQICMDHPVMKEGVELTLRQLYSTLDKFAIKMFDPKGLKFDPLCHEAMTMIDDPNVASGMIITVFQKGYWISDRLLRPARVVVAK